MMTNRSRTVVICLLLTPILLFSQQRDDFLRPFFGYYDSQSLTSAVGRATVAAGQVIAGKTSNPANLGLHRFYNIQTSFISNSFGGPDVEKSHTRFGGIYAIIPAKVYRGSLVFGLGIQREIDFTDASKTPARELTEEGGIYASEFGVSVEIAKNLFVGGHLQYLRGVDELSTFESDSSHHLKPEYRGYNLSFGFVQRLTPTVQIGASVQLPTQMKVNEKLSTWRVGSPDSSTTETWNYKLRRPLVFHLGGAYLQEYFNLFYELEWTDWSDLEFSSAEYFVGDIVEINGEIEHELRSTVTHHFGAAIHPPMLPAHFYAGYQLMPVQFEGVYGSNKREALSFGSSCMLNQQFSLHGSYSHYYWKYLGKKERNGMLVFGVTLHY